ncbi:MAG: hypothetical protein HQL27_04005 [Candidatus Omnitrophica bacterium]|nr:hypothetical protein [Candidatus Omnitrophota bacterium]
MRVKISNILNKYLLTLLSGFIVSVSLLSYGFTDSRLSWMRHSNGISEKEVKKVTMSKKYTNRVYAATDKGFYLSEGKDVYFRRLFNAQIIDNEINDYFVDAEWTENAYLVTSKGVYESKYPFNRFNKIKYANEGDIFKSIVKSGGTLYLGALSGVYSKEETKPLWNKFNGRFKGISIYKLFANKGLVFAFSINSIFRIKGDEIEEVLSLGINSKEAEVDDSDIQPVIKDMFFSDDGKTILTLTERGIYCSSDEGLSFKPMPIAASFGDDLNAISVINDSHGGDKGSDENLELIAGTQRGAYGLKNGKWFPVQRGMEATGVNMLDLAADKGVYAATDSGVFFLSLGQALPDESETHNTEVKTNGELFQSKAMPIEKSTEKLAEIEKFEPQISRVQGMAVEYAEVHPDKIKKWRKDASRKAWLPSLSLGLAQDKNRTIGDSIYGTYSGGGQNYVGPDDKTFYDNLGWDVSLSWDLSELIWNPDQTSIDSRSKMMVELRESVLDQITRLYFERKRLLIELSRLDANDPNFAEIRIRLEELTALIDALTGGEFSREIQRNKEGDNNKAMESKGYSHEVKS